jgi:photosystem II stability/assembly factor-like uncharacterized protein
MKKYLYLVLAAALSASGEPIHWKPIGLCGGGAMYAPAISPANPDLMMLNCDMGAAYISRDGGLTWTMIDQGQLRTSTSCRPAFHPADTNIIYAAQAGVGLKVSRDSGIHWNSIKTPAGDLRGEIGIDPGAPSSLMIGDGKRVFRSGDAGRTWTVCEGPHGAALAFHFDQTSPATKRVILLGTREGVWRSDDAGETWTEKSTALGNAMNSFSAGSSAAAKTCMLYASIPSTVAGDTLSGGVFRSSDRGETWESCMGGGINVETKAFDPWAHGPVAQYAWVLTCNSNPRIVWAFNSNTGVPPPHHAGAYRSSDGGRTWKPTYFPDPRFPGYNCDSEFMTTVDRQYYQGVPLGVAIDSADGDRVIQCDGSYCFSTINGGAHWQNCAGGPAPIPAGSKEPRWRNNGLVVTTTWNYYIDPFESRRRYIGYTDIGFARSLDRDASWIWWAGSGRAPWGNTTYELAFDPETPGKIWGAFSDSHDIPNYNAIGGGHRTDRDGGVCLSTNFAAAWQRSNQGLPNHPVTSVVVDPHSTRNHRTLYASVFGDGVFKSADDGATWSKSSEGIADPANRRVCRLLLHADETLLVLVTGQKTGGRWAPGAGVYRSRDSAAHWERITASREFAWPKDITVDPARSDTI